MRELNMHEIQQVSGGHGGGHGEALSNHTLSAGMFSRHGNRYGGYFDGHPDDDRPRPPGEIPPPSPPSEEEDEQSCAEAVGEEILISALIGIPPAIGAFFLAGGFPSGALVLGTAAYTGGISEYRNNPNCHDDDDDS